MPIHNVDYFARQSAANAQASANNALQGGSYNAQVYDVTASRATGSVYTNSTGHEIGVMVACQIPAGGTIIGQINMGAGFETVAYASEANSGSQVEGIYFKVPAGATYKNAGNTAITQWVEVY